VQSTCTCTNHAARLDKLSKDELHVAWNGTYRCSPRATCTDCAFRYTGRTSMLHELGANDPIQLEPLRCVPGNSPTVNRITGMHAAGQVAGCGAQLRSTACPPSVTFQAVTARRAGRNSQNRGQHTCFAAVGWDGASGRGCLTISPQPAHEHPPLACTQPSRTVSHPADTRHRALGGAQHIIIEEGSFLGLGKGYITKEALDTPW
jgi:hypothetical protein